MIYKKLLYLAVIFILSGCSTVNNNFCYDYYGNAIDITNLKDSIIITDEYVYAFISDGQAWNSLESPEIFNQELIDLRIANRDSYSKLSINDSVNSKNNTLVLCQAETIYEYNSMQNEIAFISSHAWFNGELSIKGYITLDNNNTIVFLPGNGEWNGLPMLYYETKTAWSKGGYEIISNAPIITLGNQDDYNNSKVTVKADKSLQEVYITINDLELCWMDGDYGNGVNTANIINISYL